jgi:NADPH-dependent 2,4-dienoyl-CoA reductase/sulfur reductase-like enzyme
MQRRTLVQAAAASAVSLLAPALRADSRRLPSSEADGRGLAPPAQPKARVVVVGGGMAGATVAKYLRLWGDAVDVTLVDRQPVYTSCIMSSLVLTGQRSLSSLNFTHDALRSRYGVRTVYGEVRAIDPVAARVTLADGQVLAGDRLVVAPGIEFDEVPGLVDSNRMPHAWKAGPQTSLLAQQLAAMPSNGVAVLTIPPAPYRCPPGPYERACLLADWMRVKKPRAKLIVLDANPDFVTEKDNFSRAFFDLHGAVIEYRTKVVIDAVDPASMSLFTNTGSVRGDVVNLIPWQRAPGLLADAGLLNDAAGRFAAVNVLSYASTAAPRTHVIGDASATTQPKAGHIANQEAKVCADALARIFAGGSPDPAPVTNSACFSTITMTQASWLHGFFQYDPASATMQSVAAASGASEGWNGDHFEDMGTWFRALMSDSFA